MVSLFRRRPKGSDAPKLRSRSESRSPSVDTTLELTPDLRDFLGRSAVFELSSFESIAAALTDAPSLVAKEALSVAANESLQRHHALVAELLQNGADPSVEMEAYASDIADFRVLVRGATWHESLLSCYIVDAILTDLSATLAEGLPRGYRERVLELFDASDGDALILETLKTDLAGHTELSARMALWGRRLVGDTLLQARAALRSAAPAANYEATIAPVIAELIAAHTRRMYALGLTA